MDNQDNVAPEKVIINGVEYDPSDAQSLIELGQKTKDFESQYNTDLSKVYPDYTRATQEASQLKKEKEAWEQERAKYQPKTDELPDRDSVLANARKYGLVDENSLKEKYVSREDLDKYWSTKTQEQRDAQEILDTGVKLSQEITGEDGRARYLPKAVLAYASNYGFFKQGVSYEQALRNAYNDMNAEINASWKDQELAKAQKPGLTTLKGGSNKKAPAEKKITNEDEFKEALSEALWGGSEE